MSDTTLEAVLKRDRALVAAGLAGAVALAWLYLFAAAAGGEGATAMTAAWGTADLGLLFVMWAVMMVGMMVPSAAPTMLLFAMVNRRQRARGGPFAPTGAFALGYILVWAGFSAAATGLQWGLHEAALLSPMMVATGNVFGGLVLVAAGGYQWTPLKRACLRHCRSPLDFITRRWRPGPRGALAMGIEHGAYCLGCCWVLMGLLFVGGVMNLVWVAAIAAFVLAEKLAPRGDWVSRLSGGAMMAAGAYLLTFA